MDSQSREPVRNLSFIDCTSLIVGSIVGVGIFEVIPGVAALVTTGSAAVLLWAAGGILSLVGALCYAELGSAYPKQGGDYYFLKRAFGPAAGFLYAWAAAVVIRPGSIAALALPCARYLQEMIGLSGASADLNLAVVLVGIVTVINMLGVRLNARLQNGLTAVKVLGLVLLIVAGFSAAPSTATEASPAADPNAWIALVLILFAYGGWSDVTLAAAEIKDTRRDLGKALVTGTVLVALIYTLLNLALVCALTLDGIRTSPAVATAVSERVLKSGFAASALVFLCALGALHAFTFTGARVTAALGADFKSLNILGRWSPRFETPFAAIGLQGVMSIFLLMLIASFEGIIVYTTAAVWTFYALTGAAVIVLRERDGQRVWKVPLYPVPPLIFCCLSLVLVYQAVAYDFWGSTISFVIVLAGLPAYRIAARNQE